MLVTFLMSTYNEPIEWIESSLNSMINQTYSNLEIIIIVDNPDYYELINYLKVKQKEDNRINLIVNKKNLGLVKSLNKGLKIAKGEFIARMDADDISFLNRIEKQLNFSLSHNLDISSGGRILINELEEPLREENPSNYSTSEIKKILKYKNIIAHPTWFVKKSVYKDLNGYRNIHAAEDYDFLVRAIKNEYILGTLSDSVLYYRVSDGSISKQNIMRQFLTTYLIGKNIYSKSIIIEDDLNNALNKKLTEKNINKFDAGISLLQKHIEFRKNKK